VVSVTSEAAANTPFSSVTPKFARSDFHTASGTGGFAALVDHNTAADTHHDGAPAPQPQSNSHSSTDNTPAASNNGPPPASANRSANDNSSAANNSANSDTSSSQTSSNANAGADSGSVPRAGKSSGSKADDTKSTATSADDTSSAATTDSTQAAASIVTTPVVVAVAIVAPTTTSNVATAPVSTGFSGATPPLAIAAAAIASSTHPKTDPATAVAANASTANTAVAASASTAATTSNASNAPATSDAATAKSKTDVKATATAPVSQQAIPTSDGSTPSDQTLNAAATTPAAAKGTAAVQAAILSSGDSVAAPDTVDPATVPVNAITNNAHAPIASAATAKQEAGIDTDATIKADAAAGLSSTTAGAPGHQHSTAAAANAVADIVDASSQTAGAIQPPLSTAATSSVGTLTVTAATGAPIPMTGLAVEIAASAKSGKSSFEIRLDPAELGRIDVRINVDRNGLVTSHLTVEKPETLSMLQQDAPQLQRALDDAGLKTGSGGLQFSLRDQSSSGQNNSNDTGRNTQRLVIHDEDTVPSVIAGRTYGRMLGSNSGVDISV
jgi:flagellar hook-length control protein FliK